MNRRDFLKCGAVGLAFISLKGCGGSHGYSGGVEAGLKITEVLHEMIDGTKVYSWAFADEHKGPMIPGPVISAVEGGQVELTITNTLKEDHAFVVPGVVDSGVIAPGETVEFVFTVPAAGSYMYMDPLNAPVNRVLGLHGCMLVLPKAGNTPYSNPTPSVQRLFDDLGTTDHFPKNALSPAGWQRDRSRIWLQSQVDPVFNALAEKGARISPSEMKAGFLPRYFTINGKSGAFASHDPGVVLSGRIGQPMLVRILNAGLFIHSDHLHANHVYVTAINGEVSENVIAVDTFSIKPEDRVDWLVPFVRPPDIPGDRSATLRSLLPNELALVIGGNTGVPQSPLVYPMHCHNETSQTAAGGNYPQGTVTHFEFLGDLDGVDFPNAESM